MSKTKAKLEAVGAPSLKRVTKPKEEKTPKRVTGTLVYVGTATYNDWRETTEKLINGDAETKLARLVQFSPEEVKEYNSIKWAGHIATRPEDVEEVTALLNEYLALYPADKFAVPFTMLETFRTVEPTPRVRKTKEKKNTAKA